MSPAKDTKSSLKLTPEFSEPWDKLLCHEDTSNGKYFPIPIKMFLLQQGQELQRGTGPAEKSM